MNVDGEIDGATALKRPLWLEILLNKFISHIKENDDRSVQQSITFDPINLGQFCAFLSCCTVGRIAVRAEEHLALVDVR